MLAAAALTYAIPTWFEFVIYGENERWSQKKWEAEGKPSAVPRIGPLEQVRRHYALSRLSRAGPDRDACCAPCPGAGGCANCRRGC